MINFTELEIINVTITRNNEANKYKETSSEYDNKAEENTLKDDFCQGGKDFPLVSAAVASQNVWIVRLMVHFAMKLVKFAHSMLCAAEIRRMQILVVSVMVRFM